MKYVMTVLVFLAITAILVITASPLIPDRCEEQIITPLMATSEHRRLHCEKLGMTPVIEFFHRCGRSDVPVVTGCGPRQ